MMDAYNSFFLGPCKSCSERKDRFDANDMGHKVGSIGSFAGFLNYYISNGES